MLRGTWDDNVCLYCRCSLWWSEHLYLHRVCWPAGEPSCVCLCACMHSAGVCLVTSTWSVINQAGQVAYQSQLSVTRCREISIHTHKHTHQIHREIYTHTCVHALTLTQRLRQYFFRHIRQHLPAGFLEQHRAADRQHHGQPAQTASYCQFNHQL